MCACVRITYVHVYIYIFIGMDYDMSITYGFAFQSHQVIVFHFLGLSSFSENGTPPKNYHVLIKKHDFELYSMFGQSHVHSSYIHGLHICF